MIDTERLLEVDMWAEDYSLSESTMVHVAEVTECGCCMCTFPKAEIMRKDTVQDLETGRTLTIYWCLFCLLKSAQ